MSWKRINTFYLFIAIALLVMVASVMVYRLFLSTRETIETTQMRSNLEYVDDVTANIARQILAVAGAHPYETLKKDPRLRERLESGLQLLVTRRYRYVYVVDRASPSARMFRFLLDGSHDPEERSEFGEPYEPFNLPEWEKVYQTKAPHAFEHHRLKSLWMTYLKPVVADGQVVAVIAIDFSLFEHRQIVQVLQELDASFVGMLIFAFFIFMVIVMFAYFDATRIRLLKEQSRQIARFNETLKRRIAEEVEKNRQKDQLLMQQSRLAQMGEMISMIAHQWRQPLSAIGSTATVLILKARRGTLDKTLTVELAEKIAGYTKHLSSTIDDFREFFKPNKELRESSFGEIVASVMGIVETSLRNKNIDLQVVTVREERFGTYPNEIKQVVLNLIKNAEDVLLERGVEHPRIRIEIEGRRLRIFDNGGGVPPEILEKIFDPYFSTKQKRDGTGLGLYMSKIIIEEHCGGKLYVTNKEEGGMFVIDLSEEAQTPEASGDR